MRERKTGRLLALLLVAALLLSLLPATVLAVEPGAATTSNDDSFMRIVHLDCGRKYFSVKWVKNLIDEMAENGYTHLELAFGNNGLRFLLDNMDMDVTDGVDTWMFGSDAVKDAIKDGNDAYDAKNDYYPGDTEEWTQDDMDEIISYATSKNISIIPLLNTPGHMDAILSAANSLGSDNFGYNGSETTIDLQKSIVVAFTQALVEMYVEYFASKGCEYFNLGADEYANDTGTDGFASLQGAGLYDDFVGYVNDLANVVKDAGMKAIVFNDGVCYNQNTSSMISTDVLVSYWSSGWFGYDVASAEFLSNQGYSLINTHGDYYYVLKDTGPNASSLQETIQTTPFSNTAFMGSQVSNPVGSMFCIWCDFPGTATEDVIYDDVVTGGILSSMASAMKDETTDPEPDYKYEKTISLAEGEKQSVTVNDVNLSGEYTPTPEEIASVEVKYNESVESTPGYWQKVTNGTSGIVSGGKYLIVGSNTYWGTTSYYALTKTGGAQSVTVSNNQITVVGENAQFTLTSANGGYTIMDADGTYLYPNATRNRRWSYSLNSQVNPGQPVTISGSNGSFTIGRSVSSSRYSTTSYIAVDADWRGNVDFTADSSSSNLSLYSYVPGTSSTTRSSTIIFTGLKEGSASVVIGGTKYTIKVTPKSLVGVEDLTIEYWITNGRPVDGKGNNSVDISASAVYSESGVDVTEFVPENTIKETRTLQYWRCRLLDTTMRNNSTSGREEQTEDAGDDETYNGREFTKVRYWNDTWSVYCVDKNEWVVVESKHQLVAYYLEILPVADELLVNAADWGKKGDGSTSGDYLEPSAACTVSVQVIYEDGTTNPKSTSAADLRSRTIAYGYWTNGRGIGTLNLNGLEGYQIWKIEAETGSHEGTGDTWGSYTVNRFEWDNNAMTVYEGDPVDSYVIHNDANNPNKEGIYQNLMWNENFESILIKVYVKAPVTEDSLTVHYRVDETNVEFHHYVISVVDGTLFAENIALDSQNPNGDLLNGTVENVFGVEQIVTADLTKMSEIGAQYRYSDFECVRVDRSDDGKDVYLYYTFENTHDFVIDFGLPLTISAQDLGLTEVSWEGATVNTRCSFGSASIDTTAKTITYTPNKVLTTADTITLTFTDVNGGTVSHQIFIYPASNVLYEETFLTEATNMGTTYAPWTHSGNAATIAQSAVQTSLYGYDAAYEDSTGNSMGSSWTISDLIAGNGSKYLTTTFYGNAFDLIGTAGPDTGFVYLMLTGPQSKMVIIDTSYVDGNNTTLYQVPLAHEELTEGTYTAYIRAAYRAESGGSSDTTSRSAASTFSLMSDSSPLDEVYEVLAEFERDGFVIDDIEFVSVDENSVLSESADAQVSLFSVPATNSDTDTTAAKSALARPEGTTVTIDGFRVYREAIDSNFAAAYEQAGENNFEYINILKATLTGDNGSDFPSFAYVEGSGGEYTQATYEASGGPQNELYLKSGSGVVIYVDGNGNGAAQFSARAVTDACSFNVIVGNNTKSYTATHNTELYYEAPSTGVITVVNKSTTDMLALGNLKVLGGATVRTLSAEDVQAACLMLASAFPVDPGDTEEPGDIEEPEVPVEPETPAVFEPAKLDVKVNSTNILFNKLVTVTVSASSDVDKLTINGKTLYPTNSLLVKWGLSKTYTYIYVDTVKRSESKSYKIVAYNDAGLASAPVTVQG